MISAPRFHGRAGPGDRVVIDANAFDFHDREPGRLQMLDVFLLVTDPPFAQDVQERVPKL